MFLCCFYGFLWVSLGFLMFLWVPLMFLWVSLDFLAPCQVCHMGKRVKEDLFTVMTLVKDCYPANVDILNIYAGLYHQTFSLRLAELTSSELEINDCSYLLFWVNHYYPR